MEVMIFEDGSHIDIEALRKEFPDVAFQASPDHALALRICSQSEILVALAHHVTEDLLGAMPRLRWVAALTTGTDHLLGLKNLRADVIVTSARGIHGPQMSELALLYMISLSRKFPTMLQNQSRSIWERWPQAVLLGKTAVIVGIGLISETLAAYCHALGMTVVGVSDARQSAPHFDKVVGRGQLKDMARLADFLVVLVPLTNETRHMIDEEVLQALKPTSHLINLARGEVVDEAALIRILQAGRIAGAGLDVFEREPPDRENPLWTMPNVIITPRIGGMSDRYPQQVLPLMIQNMRAFTEDRRGEMKNVVRRPALADGAQQ